MKIKNILVMFSVMYGSALHAMAFDKSYEEIPVITDHDELEKKIAAAKDFKKDEQKNICMDKIIAMPSASVLAARLKVVDENFLNKSQLDTALGNKKDTPYNIAKTISSALIMYSEIAMHQSSLIHIQEGINFVVDLEPKIFAACFQDHVDVLHHEKIKPLTQAVAEKWGHTELV